MVRPDAALDGVPRRSNRLYGRRLARQTTVDIYESIRTPMLIRVQRGLFVQYLRTRLQSILISAR
jgi:hypothetical protein